MQPNRAWGSIRRALGWATDDRSVEHEGQVQAERSSLEEALEEVETADLPARPDEQRPS